MKPLCIKTSLLLLGAATTTASVLLGACSSKSSDGKSTFLCASATDCDGLTGKEGHICLGGQCSTCSADWQCSQVSHYGAGARCVSGRCSADQKAADQKEQCIAGVESCACQVDGTCRRGLICDDKNKTCRQPKKCADIECGSQSGEGQGTCIPSSDGKDATCTGTCTGTQKWDSKLGACVQAGASCSENDPTSLLEICTQKGRTCETASGASAGCGKCREGYVESGTDCVPKVRCADLDCAATNQICAESPNGHCTDCLQGYVKDPTGSRCLATCAALKCESGQECVEHTADASAVCVKSVGGTCPKVPTCGTNEAWNPMWQACQDCGNLSCVADERHTGKVFPVVTNQFRCICETKPGYYFDSATLRAEACDADGDKWVRRSAWDALSRPTDCAVLGDPRCDCALHDNARCQVQTIDRFVLHNIYGEKEEILLAADDLTKYTVQDGQLALFETDANDDLTLRDAKNALPPFASAGADKTTARQLRANELHSLTKGCLDKFGDLNGNQQSDLTEYQGAATIPGPDWLLPFTHFSYFVELYDGWYEPNAQNPKLAGSFHIREKARRADEGQGSQLPFFSAQAADYSQMCHRMRDKDFVAVPSSAMPNIGMDFARFDKPDALARFGHHSQFKCLEVVSDDTWVNARQAPQQVRQSVVTIDLKEPKNLYDIESCSLDAGAELSAMKCNVAATPTVGTVGFGRVKYHRYAQSGGYTRGCLNECAEQMTLLATPGVSLQLCPTTGHYGCDGDDKNYGKYSCGCEDGWDPDSGCSNACPTWYLDADGDDHYDASTKTLPQCNKPQGGKWHEAPVQFDCDDKRADVHPGVSEVCNGIDDNCDGQTDEGLAAIKESCNDLDDNCNGEIDEGLAAVKETCNKLDDNCDGQIDEGLDYDADGDGRNATTSCNVAGDDCNDNDPNVYPGADEVCDERDNNCNEQIDEGIQDLGAPCSSGVGVCARSGQLVCAGAGLPLVCKTVQGVGDGSFHSTADPVTGSWDWDCDGKVRKMYNSDPNDSAWVRSVFDAALTEVQDKTCTPYYKGKAKYIDATKLCAAAGNVNDILQSPGESTGSWHTRQHGALEARCTQSALVVSPFDGSVSPDCGSVLLEFKCKLDSDYACVPMDPTYTRNMAECLRTGTNCSSTIEDFCLCTGESAIVFEGFPPAPREIEYDWELDCSNAERKRGSVNIAKYNYALEISGTLLRERVQQCL